MNNAFSRPVLVSALVGVLAVFSFVQISEKQSLSARNRELMDQSRGLQTRLEQLETRQLEFTTATQGHEKEKQELRDSIESLRKQNESLAFQLKKIESQIGSVKEEKSYLEEMLINKTKQIEILKSSGASGDASSGTISSQLSAKEEDLRRLNDQNRLLQEKMDRLFRTTNESVQEINVAKIALSETVSSAQKRIEDEWNTVNLGSVTTSAKPMRQNEVEEAPREPKSEGHVLAINNEHGFVVIDLGKVDNLPPDAQLEVYKNGIAIAKLTVLEIRDVMAACNIQEVQDGQRIEINDPVSILR